MYVISILPPFEQGQMFPIKDKCIRVEFHQSRHSHVLIIIKLGCYVLFDKILFIHSNMQFIEGGFQHFYRDQG
jgi:hypothetical protein